jgi:hypothetical protein
MLILEGGVEGISLPPQNINTAKTYSGGTEKKSKETLYRRDYGSDRSRFETILLDREPML